MPQVSIVRKEQRTGFRSPIASATGDWPVRDYDDPDKTLVMNWIGGLIRNGHAEWGMLGNGDIELRFLSGEVFHLRETTILRVS